MSSPDYEFYQHEVLGQGQIRVLFIRWAMNSDDMVCAIYHTVPGEINYTAISYAWEPVSDNDETVTIPLVDIVDVEYENGTTGLAFTDQRRRLLNVKSLCGK